MILKGGQTIEIMEKLANFLLLVGLSILSAILVFISVRPVAEKYEKELQGIVERSELQRSSTDMFFVISEPPNRWKIIGTMLAISVIANVITLAHFADRGLATYDTADAAAHMFSILLLGTGMPVLFSFFIGNRGPNVIVVTDDGINIVRAGHPDPARSVRWAEVEKVRLDYYRNSRQVLALVLRGPTGKIVARVGWNNFDALCRELLTRVPTQALGAEVVRFATTKAR